MDVAGRGEDGALDGAGGADGVDHVLDAGDVGVVAGQVGTVEVAASGEVDDVGGAEIADGFGEGGAVEDAALAQEVSVADVAHVILIEIENFPVVGEKTIDEICADETRSTGYGEDPCHECSEMRISACWRWDEDDPGVFHFEGCRGPVRRARLFLC